MVELRLRKINKPKKGDLARDINWFCDSLCLSSGRDTQFISTKIISDIINKISEHEKVFSESIAKDLEIKQGLVNHHLRNLIDSGIVVREKKQIFIRGGSLKEAVLSIRRDALSMFEDIKKIAEEIDNEVGLINRQ